MNIISYCDGLFICIRCMYNLPVSREANVLSRVAALRFRSGLTDKNAGKVSVGNFAGGALLVGALAVLVGGIMAGAQAVLAGVIMAGTLSCWSR